MTNFAFDINRKRAAMFFTKIPVSQSKQIKLPGIGSVKITRKRKCKRLCIRVNQSNDVRVTIPFRTSFDEGEKFLFEKIDWIRQAIEKLSTTQGVKNLFTTEYSLQTRGRIIKVQMHEGEKFVLRIYKEEFHILVPSNADILNLSSQATIEKMVTEAIRNEAKEYLPLRTKQLAAMHNLTIREIKIKNASTRWGSCSVNNNINLNMHLIRLPDELLDYIILHELAHTVHKNHGPRFWEMLENIAGQAKEKAVRLRKYKLGFFN